MEGRSIALRCLMTVLLLVMAGAAQALAAETPVEAQVNVPYVVQFGFGSYDVGGLSTETLRIPLSHCVALGEEHDDWRLKFTGYFGYSHARFESNLLGPKLTADQDYVFVLPQVAVQIPLRQGWFLKPYLAAGAGCAFNGSARLEGYGETPLRDTYDFLYAAGITHLVEVPWQGLLVSLANKVGWAEEVAVGGGRGQGFATLQNGLEIRHPLGLQVGDRPLDLAESFIHYFFFPAARFSIPGQQPLEVSNQYEFGATIGFAKPTTLWILENPRIGASYRFGDGLTGFRVNLGFPF